MRRRGRLLPDVPVHHLLWGIPASFGGMTTVALQRASLLADLDRRRMDVLTLSPDLAPRARRRELYLDGLISRRVRIRNLWAELRRAADSALARLSDGAPASTHEDHERTPSTGHVDHVRADEDGRELQVARFRDDGSLLLTDRQDVTTPRTRGGRRRTLYARSREALGQWSSATAFYHAWLRSVVGDEHAAIICDSAFVGGLMQSFSSPHASLIQVIHSHHHDADNGTLGSLASGKLPILKNADAYDLLAVLTERQKKDLLEEDIASDNIVAIPNPFHGRVSTAAGPRTRERGIVVSRLSGIKRIDHAIRAISSSTASTSPTLDIYGDGQERERLEECIAGLDLGDRVRLHGHDSRARTRFAQFSFSLLTSRTEGQSLMLVESMAGGCIPIAYDIDYGPSDIITDGVDGLLVPAEDPEALTQAIDRFLAMDEARVADMRDAAIDASKRFSADGIAAQWAQAIQRVVGLESGDRSADDHDGADRSAARGSVSARLVDVGLVGDRVAFSAQLDGADRGAMAWAKLALIGRRGRGYKRLPLQVSGEDHRPVLTAELPIEQLVVEDAGALDLFVDARISGLPVRVRLAAGTCVDPVPLGDLEHYATVRGNASIRRAADTTSPARDTSTA